MKRTFLSIVWSIVWAGACIAIILFIMGQSLFAQTGSQAPTPLNSLDKSFPGLVQPDPDFGNFPLYFIQNNGQVDKEAGYYAKTTHYTLWLTNNGLVFDSIRKPLPPTSSNASNMQKENKKEAFNKTAFKRDISRISFLSANKAPKIVPMDNTPLKVNVFMGNDRSKWYGNIPTSRAVLYKALYKKIDLRIYGIEKEIEYDWVVKPGGNPLDIGFQYKNVKSTGIDEKGNLLVETDFGELVHKKPVSFQVIDGKRIPVVSTFRKIGKNSYGFRIGNYNHRYELIIDPVVLAYSSYIGGNAIDYPRGVAADNRGGVYITGYTASTDYPVKNQFQGVEDSFDHDVFVTKIDTTRGGESSLVYSTYLGGGLSDEGYAIAIDNKENVYVTGRTWSEDFPLINQLQTYQGPNHSLDEKSDAFLVRLDTRKAGISSLIYSTYLGGNNHDEGLGVAVTKEGVAFITGSTGSTDFLLLNAYQSEPSGIDTFITKLDTNLSGEESLCYSTYFGGSNSDYGLDIAVDDKGNAFITGKTDSEDLPLRNQYQDRQGGVDAFVAVLDTGQTGDSCLVGSTYLGSRTDDRGVSIAVDKSGYIYTTGFTLGADFPVSGSFQSHMGHWDVFVTKLYITRDTPTILAYSTILGGGDEDCAKSIAVDGSGNAYITGYTRSSDFPVRNQFQTDLDTEGYKINGNSVSADSPKHYPIETNIGDTLPEMGYDNICDTFVAKVNTGKSGEDSLVYSTYLGGTDWDSGRALDIDNAGNAYVIGATTSADFPIAIPFQEALTGFPTQYSGFCDVFVTKLTYKSPPSITTTEVKDITPTTASSGGLVTRTGGKQVTARGVCWSTTENPTIANEHTNDGSGSGRFTSLLTGLTPGTAYYVKAYAINSIGISYGNTVTFTSAITIPPSVTTAPVSQISQTSAFGGGIVTSDGYGVVSNRGVCWNTSPQPAIDDGVSSFTSDGSGTGEFSSAITGLNEGTLYYIRAYAVNDAGTAYGNERTFTTLSAQAPHPCTISGTVRLDGSGIAGISLEFSGDNEIAVTDENGFYSHSVFYGWTGTVTPTGSAQTFDPASRSYENITSDLTEQDYSAETMPSEITLNRTRYNFGAAIDGEQTGAQTLIISNAGGGKLKWRAETTESWIHLDRTKGSEKKGNISISVDSTGLSAGMYTGIVRIVDDDQNDDQKAQSRQVDIVMKVYQSTSAPVGIVETPIENARLAHNVSVTGWVVDDIDVEGVKIYRVDGNEQSGNEHIYLGDGLLLEDVRPDVEAAYPDYPRNYRGGWGFDIFTHFLPGGGNGYYTFIVKATDIERNEIILGERTVFIDNKNSVLPFGTLDTPGNGEIISGKAYINWGWALTPQPNTIPTDGSTIWVWIDGKPVGQPVYNINRRDIADLFPGYNNTDGAVGYFYLDTTQYEDGLHTIAWSVIDDAGNANGIGSRYFFIDNSHSNSGH